MGSAWPEIFAVDADRRVVGLIPLVRDFEKSEHAANRDQERNVRMLLVEAVHGADDLHGTIVEEHIFHMAGAESPQLQTETDMVKAIREAGRTPVQRNTFYEPIKILETPAAFELKDNASNSKVSEENLATA